MSAHPVEIDELEHAGLLFQFILCQRSSEPGGALVQRQRFVRQSQILEDALVESIMSEEQLLDPPQEPARLSPLDDPVIIGAADVHDLAQTQAG